MPKEAPGAGSPRPNTPLIAMVMVGIVATLGGLVWAVIAFDQLNRNSAAAVQVLAALPIAVGVVSAGLSLLLIAWIIAAARWPSHYE